MLVAYVRTATDSQEALRRQFDLITDWEEREQKRITLTYIDTACSGNSDPFARDDFVLALSQLRRGDTLVVTEFSSISRNLVYLAAVLALLIKQGVNVELALPPDED